MNPIKRKILLDLFVVPITMVPVVIGATVMLFGFAVTSPSVMFLGGIGVMVGGAIGACRALFNYSNIVNATKRDIQVKQLEEQRDKLDWLEKQLKKTPDARDEAALKNLRSVYDSFMEDALDGKLSQFFNTTMGKEIETVFNTCVGLLEHSFDIWKTAKGMDGEVKKTVLNERERILDKVDENVTSFVEVVHRIRALRLKDGGTVPDDLQRQLKISLRAAEHVQDEMRRSANPDDLSRYAEFRT